MSPSSRLHFLHPSCISASLTVLEPGSNLSSFSTEGLCCKDHGKGLYENRARSVKGGMILATSTRDLKGITLPVDLFGFWVCFSNSALVLPLNVTTHNLWSLSNWNNRDLVTLLIQRKGENHVQVKFGILTAGSLSRCLSNWSIGTAMIFDTAISFEPLAGQWILLFCIPLLSFPRGPFLQPSRIQQPPPPNPPPEPWVRMSKPLR